MKSENGNILVAEETASRPHPEREVILSRASRDARRLAHPMRPFGAINPLGSLDTVLMEVLAIRIAILAVLMEVPPIFTQIATVLHNVPRILSYISSIGSDVCSVLLNLVGARACLQVLLEVPSILPEILAIRSNLLRILTNVPPIVADVPPVLPNIPLILAKIPAVLAQIAGGWRGLREGVTTHQTDCQ